MLLGFGVRSACMRKPRSIAAPGGWFRLRLSSPIAKSAACGSGSVRLRRAARGLRLLPRKPDAVELPANRVEHLAHVRVQLFGSRRARDPLEWKRPAEQPGERSGLGEQALRVERAPARAVFRARQLALERRLEPV